MPLFNNFPLTDFHQMNLDWLIRKVKELEPLQDSVNEIAGKYNDMYNKVVQLSTDFDSFATDVQNNIIQFVNSAADYITESVNEMVADLNDFQAIITQRVSDVETRMDNVERSVVNAAYMDSPFTGESVPVQEVIYQLASLHMTGAITAGDYDAAELTASAYEALDLTAYTYDWDASSYIS